MRYYKSFTTHRCGVCNKFFSIGGRYLYLQKVECPHCKESLTPEPIEIEYACSGVQQIIGTGVLLPSGCTILGSGIF